MDTLINEEWRQTEFPTLLVSNLGGVKRNDGFIYSTTICCSNGYRYVTLWVNGKTKTVKISRLVAKAFIENPENKPHVDHINTIRTDDRVENLRWVTREENMHNNITRKKILSRGYVPKPWRRVPILQYAKDGTFIREWDAATSFGRSIGKDVSGNIIACIKGKQKTAYGYIWKYKCK